jgi:hypothetical protein
MLMVLEQDGFDVTLVNQADSEWRTVLTHHLEKHMAILLIKRPQTGGLHWVAAYGNGGTVEVIDSMEPFSYRWCADELDIVSMEANTSEAALERLDSLRVTRDSPSVGLQGTLFPQ